MLLRDNRYVMIERRKAGMPERLKTSYHLNVRCGGAEREKERERRILVGKILSFRFNFSSEPVTVSNATPLSARTVKTIYC